MYLGSECSLRQRVPLGAVSFESLSPENESISGSTEDPDVVREEPPLWWTPHNPLSPGCFWAMTPGLPEDFRSLPSLPKSGGNSSPPQAAAPEARGSYKSSSPGSASRSRSASVFRPRHGRLLPLPGSPGKRREGKREAVGQSASLRSWRGVNRGGGARTSGPTP